jgi:nucleoside-diphosphate-sugar epimerase
MYLITGATGMLGSQLALDLVLQGHPVKLLIRKTSSLSLLKHRFKGYEKEYNNLTFVQGDLMDVFSLDDALEDCTRVYHCAAQISFDSKKRKETYRVNAEGTANLVDACINKQHIRFGHVSSVAVLGRKSNDMEITENDWFLSQSVNSYYAVSKYAAEREVWRGINEGLQAVIINPSIIVGVGNWHSDSSSLFSKVYHGLKYYTKGVSGFVDVQDVSACFIQLMDSEIEGERYIVSSENKSFEWLLKTIAQSLKVKGPTIYAGKILASVAWRIEYLKSLVSGKPSLITSETAYSAQQHYNYSNQKITDRLDYHFKPISKTIEETSRLFIDHLNQQISQ